MNATVARRFSAQPLLIRADERGLIVLDLKRKLGRPPEELPPDAGWREAARARMDRLIDFLFSV
ncbi:MAG: hypothetical protein WCS99_06075 [Limisphaerales bacterium]